MIWGAHPYFWKHPYSPKRHQFLLQLPSSPAESALPPFVPFFPLPLEWSFDWSLPPPFHPQYQRKTEILDGAFSWFVFVNGFLGNVSNQRWPTALKIFLLQTSKNTRSPFKKMPKISQGVCDSETDTTLSSLHRCCFSLLQGKLTSQVLQRHFSTSSDQLKIHKNGEKMFFQAVITE